MRKNQKVILVVEDDAFLRKTICNMLQDRGFKTVEAHSETEAIEVSKAMAKLLTVALIDMRVPSKRIDCDADSAKGMQAGLRIARTIRETSPQIRLVGMSHYADEEVRDWFAQYGSGFLRKSWLLGGAAADFIDVVENVARKKLRKRNPRIFIVHGRDDRTLHELIHFIQRSLKWPMPIVLRELPSKGLTIIEKFEEASSGVDIVFVLLTPDDKVAPAGAANDVKRKARQNVIFELGYFFAKLQRIGGHVILLHRGAIELPSDIAGIGYVEIAKGIDASGEAIRRELANWLP